MKNVNLWRPSATQETARARSRLVRAIRSFFEARDVLEVDTPILSQFGTVDPHIDSFSSVSGHWLQTSPEFAMKRLVCAGYGPIFQIAHVFRREEAGRHHNPEFSLLEWYRPQWEYRQLMQEVGELMVHLGIAAPESITTLTYREAFRHLAGVDPMTDDIEQLESACRRHYPTVPTPLETLGDGRRDFYLDLLMSAAVAPRLGAASPVLVCDFPPSQAALARIRADVPPVAERFELFWKGVELANGFSELTDAEEQSQRFQEDQARRRVRGQEVPPSDARLIEALRVGMPACAGVALGIDRLLMLSLGLPSLADVMAFDFPRA